MDQLLTRGLLIEQADDESQLAGRPYIFTHDKIRDVVYAETGAARRQIFHRHALETLTHTFAPPAELAQHAFAAGLMEPAFQYSLAAGDEAMSMVATHETITHYSRARELFEKKKIVKAGNGQLIHLYSSLGRALELSGQFPEALARYKELESLSRHYGDSAMELAALLARVTLHATPTAVSDPIKAQALSERALALSRDLNDQAAEAKLLWNLSHVYRVTNRMSQAINSGEQSLALARSLNLREQIAFTLNDLGSHCYFMCGRFVQARVALSEASVLWQELGNLPMLVDSLASTTLVASFAGEYDQVLSFSDEALQISQSTGNLSGQAYSLTRVGYVYWECGRPDRAIAVMEESIRLSELAGFSVPQVMTRVDLADVYGGLGAIERGLEIASLALTAADTSLPHSDLYVMAVLAQLHLMKGSLTEADSLLEQAKEDPNRDVFPIFFVRVILADCELAYSQGDYERTLMISDNLLSNLAKFGMHTYLPIARYLKGQALLGINQRQAAQECLFEARTAAEAIGSRKALWPILHTLSQLENSPDKAQTLRRRAQEIVKYIVERISTPELHASFLNLAQVQEVLDN